MNRLNTVEEVHISSLVVHCRQGFLEAAVALIESDNQAEVHAVDPSGKIIVVLETPDQGDILQGISDIEAIEGVISATLVYHQID